MRLSRLAGLVALAFLSAALPAVAPRTAGAQAPGPADRVGIIHFSGHHQVVADGLRQGLRELGIEEGKRIVLDIREITTDMDAIEAAARDLEHAHVKLIYAVSTTVAVHAKRATTQTPIVFYAGADPVGVGLVESLAKPGGRLTGVHGLSRDLTAKRFEVLKEMIPKLARAVTFYNAREPIAVENARLAREAARRLGVALVEREVSTGTAVRLGLQTLAPRDAQAYFHTPGATGTSQAQMIIDAARSKKLPTMFHETSLVASGGLAAYGQNYHEIGRLSARHVQRVLAGIAPRDLPVENYDRVELVLNLRTAREIGLVIPPSVRARADKVFE